MGNLNGAFISGNMTRDPELRTTPTGKTVCNVGVAVNKSKKTADGGYDNEVSYFDVNVWDDFGALVARKFKKGDFVALYGEMQEDRWEDEHGNKRSKLRINARQLDGPSMYKSKDEDRDPGDPITDALQQRAAAQDAATQPALAGTAANDNIPF